MTNKDSPALKARVRIPNKEQVYEYDAEDLENLVDDDEYDSYGNNLLHCTWDITNWNVDDDDDDSEYESDDEYDLTDPFIAPDDEEDCM